MIDGKAAVVIGSSLAGAIALWAAVYGWGKWLTRPTSYVERDSFDQDARLQRIENAVEAIAVEIERLGEGQRYTTRLLAERDRVQHVPIAQTRSPTPSLTPH
jgi:hypothetical protein